MYIAAAANTETPAYLVLQSKGFVVQRHGDHHNEHWIATKGELSFWGSGTLELLGLLALYEARGDDWPANDHEINSFMSKFWP